MKYTDEEMKVIQWMERNKDKTSMGHVMPTILNLINRLDEETRRVPSWGRNEEKILSFIQNKIETLRDPDAPDISPPDPNCRWSDMLRWTIDRLNEQQDIMSDFMNDGGASIKEAGRKEERQSIRRCIETEIEHRQELGDKRELIEAVRNVFQYLGDENITLDEFPPPSITRSRLHAIEACLAKIAHLSTTRSIGWKDDIEDVWVTLKIICPMIHKDAPNPTAIFAPVETHSEDEELEQEDSNDPLGFPQDNYGVT